MTTSTLTLTDFLLARIAEDEAVARKSSTSPWKAIGPYVSLGVAVPTGTPTLDALVKQHAEHIARHDPARVLAECEAKRRIVFVRNGLDPANDMIPPGQQAKVAAHMTSFGLDLAIKYLAAVYAYHPDYREEWKP